MRHQSAALLLALASVVPAHAHDGQPDHPPKHGGLVFTSGELDAEFVLIKPHGGYQLFFSDASGEEMPASMASNVAVSVRRGSLPAEKVALHIDNSGESWVGGATGTAPLAAAMISYAFRGKAVQTDIPLASVYHAKFQTSPRQLRAGQPAQLVFTVEDFTGKSIRSLQIVHEKPMHLMIVSHDLSEFAHIHPEPSAGNTFRVPHVFRSGGEYRLFADFTPLGAGNRIESFTVNVQGAVHAPVPLDLSGAQTSDIGGIRMALSLGEPLRTGKDIGFSMSLADAKTGSPIRNLQRYLGAWAHIAIISQDTQEFIHVHPMEEEMKNGMSPSAIRTATGFRKAGVYKMWVQFQREGKVFAAPFVLHVSDGANTVSQGPQAPTGSILVKVSSAGYEPSRIMAKAGQPLTLAFYRADAQNCGRDVIFPALGIQRELPPGKTVVNAIAPRKTGSLSFSCGMKMLRGELIIQ
ncbi:MAG: hypothetical protein QOJ99_3765 [Bryobacterales bacterium]|jgi:hypothetical protein|nr:hypothetical protein [Bryobacterales bacterium]